MLLHLPVIKLQRSFFKHSYDIAVNICICAIKYKIVNNLITSLSFFLLKKRTNISKKQDRTLHLAMVLRSGVVGKVGQMTILHSS